MSVLSLNDIKLVANIDTALATQLLARLQDTPVPVTRAQIVPAPTQAPQIQVTAPATVVRHNGPGKLTDQQRLEIIEKRAQGIKIAKLAIDYNVSKQAIVYTQRKGRINKAVNSKRGGPAISPVIARLMREEYATGNVTRKALAAKYNVSINTVVRYTDLKRNLNA
jgi:hypothetical protein